MPRKKAGVKTGVLLGVGAALLGLHALCKWAGDDSPAGVMPHGAPKNRGYSQIGGPFGEVKRRKASPSQSESVGG